MPSFVKIFRLCLLLYSVSFCFSVLSVSAATPLPVPLPQDENLRREEAAQQLTIEQDQARAEAAAREAMTRRKRPIPEPAPGEPSVFIREINVKGVTRFNKRKIERIIAPYKNTRFNQAKITRLIDDLTAAYVDAGYLTSRVYIPPQNLTTGVLELQAVEGKVEKVILNKENWRDRLKRWIAVPVKPGSTLRLQNIEQGLDQINRASSAAAELTLDPGEEFGSSQVVLSNPARDPFRGIVAVDDYGTDNTGRIRGRAQVEIDNILSLNDTWNVSYLGSARSNAILGAFGVPFRWWTLDLSGSYSEALVPITPYADLLYYNTLATAKLSQVIFRSAYHKTTLAAGFEYNAMRNFINDVELSPVHLGVIRMDLTHLWRRPTTALVVGVGCSWQMPSLWEPELETVTPVVEEDNSQFAIVTGMLALQQQLAPWLLGSVNFQGQYSPKAANPTQQIYLTEYYTVRGFRSLSFGVDSGGYVRNELIVQPHAKDALLNKIIKPFSPYVFFDAGYGVPLAAGTGGEWLASVGGGIRFHWGPIVSEIWTALPLVHPNNLTPNGLEAWWSVSAKIF